MRRYLYLSCDGLCCLELSVLWWVRVMCGRHGDGTEGRWRINIDCHPHVVAKGRMQVAHRRSLVVCSLMVNLKAVI